MSYKPKILAPGDGGTGVANTGTITLDGNLSTSGAFATTLTVTNTTSVTLPTSGTLATTAQLISTPVSISNGGTNASSMATSSGIVKYNGTSLVTSTATIDTSNRYQNTSQPAFSVKLSGNIGGVTGDGTDYKILYNTVTYDQGSNWSSSNHNYVFPVAGIYQINVLYFIYTSSGSATSTSFVGYVLINGATNVRLTDANPLSLGLTANSEFMSFASFLYQASASDTMEVHALVSNGTKNIGVAGGTQSCIFSGFLVC